MLGCSANIHLLVVGLETNSEKGLSMRLYHAVYYSQCNETTRDKMPEILAQSRSNNVALDLTGALVISDVFCMQVIEGPRTSVTHLLKQILHDPRHDNCVLALLEDIEERYFPDWSMGAANLTTQAYQRLEAYGLRNAKDPTQMSGRTIWEMVSLVAGPEGRENGFYTSI